MDWFPIIAALVCVALLRRFWQERNKSDLRGKTVLITGAAHGIGRELATAFANRNSNLVLWDVREDLLEVAHEELMAHPNAITVSYAVVDVSSLEAVAAAAKKLKDRKIDVIVNNAGIVTNGHLLDKSAEKIAKTLSVNTMGPLHVLQTLLPGMLQRGEGGHVVTVSSVMAQMYANHLSDYCMSKAALSALHNILRLELATARDQSKQTPPTPPIRTSLILPYHTATGMFAGATFPKLVNRLFPPLTPQRVAERIVCAVECHEEEVYIPGYLSWITPLLGLLPTALRDWLLRRAAGGGMATFTGSASREKAH